MTNQQRIAEALYPDDISFRMVVPDPRDADNAKKFLEWLEALPERIDKALDATAQAAAGGYRNYPIRSRAKDAGIEALKGDD